MRANRLFVRNFSYFLHIYSSFCDYPVASSGARKDEPVPSNWCGIHTGGFGMRKKRILVVDGDEAYLQSVKAIAKNEGVQVSYARNEEEAWSILTENRCAAMLLDPHLPGGNSYTLATMAKALRPDITILFIAEDVPREVLLPARAALRDGSRKKVTFSGPRDDGLCQGAKAV
jgi:CheY-like chemotaxis protein